ncbi:hypothetical protein TESG_05171 [Trichophyton tonsurans CBS 112818]|uniref:Uncharacterized protein n=2 Tax=Trichophyton TaxID=5550 RepID=F2Q5Y1_TRIEC|nr:hypothetical protein TESG_05171 [Trichophyton tonsurans CBS 112818]EGE09549.1 hypothetical protein TEQG_08492 [Trichophyton equinum CBS 127.97]
MAIMYCCHEGSPVRPEKGRPAFCTAASQFLAAEALVGWDPSALLSTNRGTARTAQKRCQLTNCPYCPQFPAVSRGAPPDKMPQEKRREWDRKKKGNGPPDMSCQGELGAIHHVHRHRQPSQPLSIRLLAASLPLGRWRA